MPNILNKPSEETHIRIAEAVEKLAQTKTKADPYDSPGSKYLLAGDRNAGFFGFVQASDLINGTTLASEVGITQGTAINTETPWIKYIWKHKVCFTPLKTLRHSISWDAIYAAGAVYGTGSAISEGEQWMLDNDDNYDPDTDRVSQNAIVTIGGLQYRVRLFRGAADDPTDSYADSDRGSIGADNEWNGIILPIHHRAKTQNWNYPAYAGATEYWNVDLTDEDLLTHNDFGSGSYSWCQETRDTIQGEEPTFSRRVAYGALGASHLAAGPSSSVGSGHGFRPVLELL